MKYSLCKNCGCGDDGCEVDLIVQAERAANARLIAAAPDLLAACESALDQFEAMARDVDTNPWCEELRTAIKKARGEAC